METLKKNISTSKRIRILICSEYLVIQNKFDHEKFPKPWISIWCPLLCVCKKYIEVVYKYIKYCN